MPREHYGMPPTGHFVFKNLNVEEADRIVGAATRDPIIEIQVQIIDASSGRIFDSITRIPHQDMLRDDMSALQRLIDASISGDGIEIFTTTTIRHKNTPYLPLPAKTGTA